jgi:integrase
LGSLETAQCAAVLALNTTMRGCELKDLHWQDVDLFENTLTIRRQTTKTAAGERVITLNRDTVLALSEMRQRAENWSAVEPGHHVFPSSKGGNI